LGDFLERGEQRFGAERRQAIVQGSCCLARTDRHGTREEHRARVEPRFHLHDRHATLGIASGDRALNRRSAAPARQQGSVNVDATETRRLQDRLRKQQPVRGDDHDVGRPALQSLDRRGLTQRRRLLDRQGVPHSALLDRAGRDLLAATGGTIRLRVDGDDAMRRSQ
jgi:hypothetical protein